MDSIELATMGHAFRSGTDDWKAFGRTTMDDLRRLVALARDANPTATIGLSLFVFTGPPEQVRPYVRLYENGGFRGLAGSAAEVADGLRAFGDLGVDRITVLPPFPDSAAELAAHLL